MDEKILPLIQSARAGGEDRSDLFACFARPTREDGEFEGWP